MGERRMVVIGDPVQPARPTAEALRRRLGSTVEFDLLDWDADGDFTRTAFLVESGERLAIPTAWRPPLAAANGVVTHFFPLDRTLAELAPALEVVATLRTGTEHIAPELSEMGIEVLNNPGREADAVSDLTVALMLDLVRGVSSADRAMRAHGWQAATEAVRRPANVRETTIGLVGFGNVGRLVARKLAGFRPTILVCDPYADAAAVSDAGVELVTLQTLLERADIVSLHARLDEETRALIGAAELSLLRPQAWLVNTARAELVDEHALIEALERGRLAGVALDVLWTEPPRSDHPLLGRDDVVLTPHMAGSTTTSQIDSVELMSERLARWATRHGWITRNEGA
jgi:D-3-phosphoglycerate dehydrogenase